MTGLPLPGLPPVPGSRLNRRTQAEVDAELEAFAGTFYADPLGWVLAAFPWGEPDTVLAHYTGPRAWQCEFLEWLGGEIASRKFDGITAVPAIRAAVSSGHGAGKGALTGMLVNFLMSTRRDAKGTVTANTSTQLDDKTWAAILFWNKLSLTSHWFEANTQILFRRGFRESWRVSPQTCAPDNSEAFAGQHSERSTSFYINDEDSNVPEVIHEVQEGGLAKGEAMQFLFGNPTRRQGSFYEAVFGDRRHRFKSWVIDVRSVEGHNATWVAEMAQDYGEGSDVFRVRVEGLPPLAGDVQFIDAGRIEAAKVRPVVLLGDEPLIAGVDLAWGGSDFNVVRFRRGMDARTIPPVRIPGSLTRDPAVLTTRLADILGATFEGARVAMLFLDSAGIAGPIAARLRELGHRNLQEVNFGADSPDPTKTRYYRDFMWDKLKQWLLTGALPTDRWLANDLQQPGVRTDQKQRIWLESKEDIKKRGGHSPDDGDALALTFAAPVAAPRVRIARAPAFAVGGGPLDYLS